MCSHRSRRDAYTFGDNNLQVETIQNNIMLVYKPSTHFSQIKIQSKACVIVIIYAFAKYFMCNSRR